MNDNQQRLLDKIKRMLAVQHSTNSEGEAQAAAHLIQKMLQDHGLSMAEVEAHTGQAAKGENRAKVQTDRRALFTWQKDLMAVLANNHFCMHFIQEVMANDGRKVRRSKQHVLLGREVYVQATLLMYDYLVIAIKRAADEQGYDHRTNEKNHHIFIEGATTKLLYRLEIIKVEREEEEQRKREEAKTRSQHPGAAPSNSGTEIVLAEVYQSETDANTDVLNGLEPGTTARRRAERDAKQARKEAEYEALVSAGHDHTVALLVAHSGFDLEKAKETAARWMAEELARAARPQRKERASRARSSRGSSWTEADQRRHDRQNSPAFSHGIKTGSRIGLDTQVGNDTKGRLK